MQDNRIDLQISPEDDAKIQAHIDGLIDTLLPYLQTLTTEERRELPKLGEKSFAFLAKTMEYAELNADLVPMYLDQALFAHDVQANDQLLTYQRRLATVTTALDDSVVLTGSEAYSAALMFYHNVKLAAKNGVAHAKAVYEDLAARFPGNRRKKSAPSAT
jgi:hypothetical protein